MTEEDVRAYLSRIGRKGAEATNSKLSQKERSESARKAVKARWSRILDKLEAKQKKAAKKRRKP